MSRSLLKGPFFKKKIIINNKIKIFNKNLIILPEYVNKNIYIYNGKQFIKKQINDSMVGYKFGEFINTRKYNNYKKK